MTALEIGCGKGEFLVGLCERSGCAGIGLDPGYRPERTQQHRRGADRRSSAISTGRSTLTCMRTTCVAGTRSSTSRRCSEFVRLVRETIGDRRHVNVFFELPDMERVLQQGAFWDIYYEHCTYFTRGSLARLFRSAGFDVHRLYKAYDDQYLMLEAQPAAGPTDTLLPQENDLATVASLVGAFRAAGRRAAAVTRGCARAPSSRRSPARDLGLRVEVRVAHQLPRPRARVGAGAGRRGGHQSAQARQIPRRQRPRDRLSRCPARSAPEVVLVMNSIYVDEIRHDLAGRSLHPELIAL